MNASAFLASIVLLLGYLKLSDIFGGTHFNIDQRMNLDTPIIGLTANVFKEDVESCLAAGMNDHQEQLVR